MTVDSNHPADADGNVSFSRAAGRWATEVPDSGDRPATGLLATLTEPERRIVHSALLGQVDDNQTDGVTDWTENDHAVAADLLSRFTGRGDAPGVPEAERRAVALALIYPVHDADYPLLHPEEAAAAELMLTLLSREYGR